MSQSMWCGIMVFLVEDTLQYKYIFCVVDNSPKQLGRYINVGHRRFNLGHESTGS